MKCMYCGCLDSKVIESRSAEDGAIIRRRRECISCGKRFTTYETVENTPIFVIKTSGARQAFDPNKIKNGIIKACEKRPVSPATIDKLVDEGLLSDAVVTVEFLNFKISVMGEVNSPGTYTVEGDKVTVLQALSLARDLTIFGRRDNVSVIRELDGQRVIYQIDLTNVDLFKSPAYYLQQNDVVYVEPSKVKARQSTTDDKGLRITSILVSSGSLLISVATLIVNLVR